MFALADNVYGRAFDRCCCWGVVSAEALVASDSNCEEIKAGLEGSTPPPVQLSALAKTRRWAYLIGATSGVQGTVAGFSVQRVGHIPFVYHEQSRRHRQANTPRKRAAPETSSKDGGCRSSHHLPSRLLEASAPSVQTFSPFNTQPSPSRALTCPML